MKNFQDLFGSKTGNSEVSVNKIMFEILKSQKKFSREELKIEMFKVRWEMENGVVWSNEFFKDESKIESIKKLAIKSRNSIDTFISKNNRELLFVDYGVKNRMEFKGDRYFLELK